MRKKIIILITVGFLFACGALLLVIYGGDLLKPKPTFEARQYDPKGEVNSIDYGELIRIAREYISTEPEVYYHHPRFDEPQKVRWGDKKTIGTKLDARWIIDQSPDHVRFYNNMYRVEWNFAPGCEQRPVGETGRLDWFAEDGMQCLGGYGLIILIDTNLEPEKVLLGDLA